MKQLNVKGALSDSAFSRRRRRLDTPEEIAEFDVYLASDAASFTNGQCYVIDGGRSGKGESQFAKRWALVKLVRYGPAGRERPGTVDDQDVTRDLGNFTADIAGDTLYRSALAAIPCSDPKLPPPVSAHMRLGPCAGGVGKYSCMGLSYADHAAVSGTQVPDENVIFRRATSAICGAYDNVIQPRDSDKLHWKVELGIVIRKRARYVDTENALVYVAEYCVVNVISERALQCGCGEIWDKSNGCGTFGPIGSWLVSRNEIVDGNNLSLWLDVNGRRFQSGSPCAMVSKPNFLVRYVSRLMTLQPEDVISADTPPGVGLGQRPPLLLGPGDTIDLG